MTFNVQENAVFINEFSKKSPYPTPSPRSVASLPRFPPPPLFKNPGYASAWRIGIGLGIRDHFQSGGWILLPENQVVLPRIIHSSTHSFIHPSIHPWFIHLPIHSCMHPFINPSIHPPIHLFIHLSIHDSSIYPFILASIHSLIHPFIQATCSFIH